MFLLTRISLWPFVLIAVHTTVILWKALDQNYNKYAVQVVEIVYRPLHAIAVDLATWLIANSGSLGASLIGLFKTYLNNNPPTYHDADKLVYLALFSIYMGLLYGIVRMIRRFIAYISA